MLWIQPTEEISVRESAFLSCLGIRREREEEAREVRDADTKGHDKYQKNNGSSQIGDEPIKYSQCTVKLLIVSHDCS